jgi:hypothetical protein
MPNRRLGLQPEDKSKPRLKLSTLLTGVVPEHPIAVDHLGTVPFGLYGNDKYGDCGPTSCANFVRLVSSGLLGRGVQPSLEEVFALYRASGNPNFDPVDDADDNGVIMQDMLNAWLKGPKLGGVRPIAFARVDETNDEEMKAAISIFGGLLWGVTLDVAQQTQTDAGTWDYRKSGVWGGHAVLCGSYEAGDYEDVITWGERVRVTKAFRQNQLDEAWVVVFPWHLDHPAFQAGVNLDALKEAFKEVTHGKELPTEPPAEDASFLDAHPELAKHVDHSAHKAGMTRAQWIVHRLGIYFDVQEG